MMIYAENECVSTPFKTIYYDSSAVCIKKATNNEKREFRLKFLYF